MPAPWLIAVMGQTASGKSELAEALADRLDALLISADAFQIYCGMDIGTSKPAARDRYHLLDLKAPSEGFGVGEWLPLAHTLLETAFANRRHAIVVGGTGLYIRALFEEYSDMAQSPDAGLREVLTQRIADQGLSALYHELTIRAPEVAAKIDPQNPARVRRALERLETQGRIECRLLPAFSKRKFVIQQDKYELRKKIEYRVSAMVQNGWLEEVEGLRHAGYGPGDPGFRALGYRALWQHLAGTTALADVLDTIVRDTARYAKRQRSWLRNEPQTEAIEGEGTQHLVEDVLHRLAL